MKNEFIKSMLIDGLTVIYNPSSFTDKNGTAWKNALQDRIAFAKFNRYIDDFSDDEIKGLHTKFIEYLSKSGINSRNSVYVDAMLLKAAVDWQMVIRNINGNLDKNIAEEIAQDWAKWREEAKQFTDIDSDHLITLAHDVMQHNENKRMTWEQLEKVGQHLFGNNWQAEMARRFDCDRRTISVWKKQGVSAWVYKEIGELINTRQREVDEAADFYRHL